MTRRQAIAVFLGASMRIKQLTVGSGGGPVNSFSDQFNRALLGANWALSFGVSGNLGCDSITGQAVLAANRFVFSNTGAGSQVNVVALQLPALSGLFGLGQFSQLTMVTAAAVQGLCGPAVMKTGDQKTGMNGYYLCVDGASANIQLRRLTPPADLSLGVVGVFTAGDILRLGVVPTAANNTLSCYQNGTLINTTVDSNALRPVQVGSPCIYAPNLLNGQPYTIDDYVCGAFSA